MGVVAVMGVVVVVVALRLTTQILRALLAVGSCNSLRHTLTHAGFLIRVLALMLELAGAAVTAAVLVVAVIAMERMPQLILGQDLLVVVQGVVSV